MQTLLPLRFRPETIAVAVIFLVARLMLLKLPDK